MQARCPACAEDGRDRAGNHLRITADGRFGCCVHPKDGDHRKRIFALAGDTSPRAFTVRVASPPTTSPESRSVKATLTAFNSGTPGACKTESQKGVPSVPNLGIHPLGTLGTPLFNPYASKKTFLHTCKDLETGVPDVPSSPEGEVILPPSCAEQRLPFLTAGGTLSIPFDSPERYHWWKGGQSVKQTRAEVEAALAAAQAKQEGGVKVG